MATRPVKELKNCLISFFSMAFIQSIYLQVVTKIKVKKQEDIIWLFTKKFLIRLRQIYFLTPIMLKDKKIILGITGSIAAYKSISLLRLLTQQGASVKVVITPAAEQFVSPLVLSTFSATAVQSEMKKDGEWSNHVALGRWADLMLIAPVTCNTLAKMAYGLCDNLLLATYLSAQCRIVVAPAMDAEMFAHATTQKNIATLKTHGVEVLEVAYGALASGITGKGRMQEPDFIVDYLQQ